MLFTFPSRYSFTIGLTGVFSLAGWSRRIRAGFLVSRVTQGSAMPVPTSHTGLSPSMAWLSSHFRSSSRCNIAALQPHRRVATTMVWALPRSLATTGGIIRLFSLPAGTKMFQFPALASTIWWMAVLLTAGLSHSEIPGSMAICAFPELIAAYHVLLRLCEPRHPPFALSYFPFSLARTAPGIAHTFSCIVLP